MFKKFISTALLVAGASLMVLPVAYATGNNNPPQQDKKVWVCKYVGKPGVDERLKDGKQPISVSTHAIEHNQWNGTVPGWFSDAQGSSYVAGYDTGGQAPSCPAGEQPKTEEVTPPVYTAPTCDREGSLNLGDPKHYEWILNKETGIYTAKANEGYTLTGKTTYGPFSLKKLDGDECKTIIKVTPPVYTPPTCDREGTINFGESKYYKWVLNKETGIYTAVPTKEDYKLTGTKTFGPVSLTKLTGANCVITVKPPVYVAPTCDKVGTLTIPDPAGYTWQIVDGKYTAIVTDSNYTLSGAGPFGPFSLDKLTGTQCEVVTPPSPPVAKPPVAKPPVVVPPVVTHVVVPPKAKAPQVIVPKGGLATGDGSTAALAYTGYSPLWLFAGIGLLLAGVGTLAGSKRLTVHRK